MIFTRRHGRPGNQMFQFAAARALAARHGAQVVALDAHVLCGQAYYEAALTRVLDGLTGDATVHVFSDDPGWAKDNLPLPCGKLLAGPASWFGNAKLSNPDILPPEWPIIRV